MLQNCGAFLGQVHQATSLVVEPFHRHVTSRESNFRGLESFCIFDQADAGLEPVQFPQDTLYVAIDDICIHLYTCLFKIELDRFPLLLQPLMSMDILYFTGLLGFADVAVQTWVVLSRIF